MKSRLLLPLILLLGSGCVLSLHPFYTPETVVAGKDFEGDWRPVNDEGKPEEELWRVRDGQVYLPGAGGSTSVLKAVFFQVAGRMYLDTTALPLKGDQVNEWWRLHNVPVHMVCLVEAATNSLSLVMMDPGWVDRALTNGTLNARRMPERPPRPVLYEARPARWLELLEKHGTTNEAFGGSGRLNFIKNS